MARWANDFAIVANGGTAALDTSGALPVGPVRLMVGAVPYSATGGTGCCDAISQAAYYHRRLADSVLQTLTVWIPTKMAVVVRIMRVAWERDASVPDDVRPRQAMREARSPIH